MRIEFFEIEEKWWGWKKKAYPPILSRILIVHTWISLFRLTSLYQNKASKGIQAAWAPIFLFNFSFKFRTRVDSSLSLFFFFFLSFVLLAMRKERDESMKQFFSPRPSDFNSFHLFDARNHSDMNASAFDALLLFFFPPPSFFFNRLNFRSNKSRLFWTFSKIWRIYRGKF